MSSQRVRTRVAALVALMALCACDDRDQRYYGTTRPKHGPDEVWFNLGSEPEFLDPNKASDASSGLVILNIFSGLTQLHPVTLEPMPDIARGWEVTDGGRRYRFFLREATWSDGEPLTADDFEYSWKRLVNPKTLSRYATFLYPVKYAEEAHRRAMRIDGAPAGTTDEDVRAWVGEHAVIEKVVLAPELSAAFVHLVPPEGASGREHTAQVIAALGERRFGGRPVSLSVADTRAMAVKAVSDHVLEVEITDPLPYFLSVTAFYSTMPVPRHVFAKLVEEGKPEPLWVRPEHIASNGAYLLKEWAFRQYMVLEKNPRYWDADNVKISRVRLPMIESYNTTLNLYKAGEIDHVGESQLPAEFMEYLSAFDDYARVPYLGTYFLWINTKQKPLDDPRVREALSLAIDRESLVKYVLRAGQIPTRDLVPDGLSGYHGPGRKLFDPEAARALLKEAGYGPDRPLTGVAYAYNTNEGHKQVAEAVQQMWKKHLGAEVQLLNQEWKVYLKTLEGHDFSIARMGWIGDYADPNTFLEILRSSSGNNHSNWGDLRYDRMLEEANGMQDPTARMAHLKRAETLMLSQNPIIPIYIYTRTKLSKPFLRGAFNNYENRTYFRYMHIDERFYSDAPAQAQDAEPPMLVPDLAPSPVAPHLPAHDPAPEVGIKEAAP